MAIKSNREGDRRRICRLLDRICKAAGMISTFPLFLALLAVNGAAFAAFWWDKRLAMVGARRISESTLLWLAILGGSMGAISAQHLFRHKTRKEPFRSTLYLIAFFQIAGVAAWMLAPELIAGLVGRLSA